jgi:two-component system response regulator AtoC
MLKAPKRILLIEDDIPYARTVADRISSMGIEVIPVSNIQEAYKRASSEFFTIVILDWYMGRTDGSIFLTIKERQPDSYIIVHSGDPGVKDKCLQKGANVFVPKGDDSLDKLVDAVKVGLDKVGDVIISDLKERTEPIVPIVGDIVAQSQKMINIVDKINRFASYKRFPVLIYGETGTGKELVAKILHEKSQNSGNFVPVNCAAIPGELIESELFGHAKGAFTGAAQDKVGLFEYADHGTLFLDEIGSMPLLMQSKLLRVLQDGQIRRVGEERPREKINVRIIAATNNPLMELVSSGSFRSDLYYRLSVLNINIPPLRERREDIEALVPFFLQKHCETENHQISDSAMKKLISHSYPGNVRELENVIQRAICFADGKRIEVHHIEFDPVCIPSSGSLSQIYGLPHKEAMKEFEKLYFTDLIERNPENISECARQIGVSRPYLYKKLKQLGIGK